MQPDKHNIYSLLLSATLMFGVFVPISYVKAGQFGENVSASVFGGEPAEKPTNVNETGKEKKRKEAELRELQRRQQASGQEVTPPMESQPKISAANAVESPAGKAYSNSQARLNDAYQNVLADPMNVANRNTLLKRQKQNRAIETVFAEFLKNSNISAAEIGRLQNYYLQKFNRGSSRGPSLSANPSSDRGFQNSFQDNDMPTVGAIPSYDIPYSGASSERESRGVGNADESHSPRKRSLPSVYSDEDFKKAQDLASSPNKADRDWADKVIDSYLTYWTYNGKKNLVKSNLPKTDNNPSQTNIDRKAEKPAQVFNVESSSFKKPKAFEFSNNELAVRENRQIASITSDNESAQAREENSILNILDPKYWGKRNTLPEKGGSAKVQQGHTRNPKNTVTEILNRGRAYIEGLVGPPFQSYFSSEEFEEFQTWATLLAILFASGVVLWAIWTMLRSQNLVSETASAAYTGNIRGVKARIQYMSPEPAMDFSDCSKRLNIKCKESIQDAAVASYKMGLGRGGVRTETNTFNIDPGSLSSQNSELSFISVSANGALYFPLEDAPVDFDTNPNDFGKLYRPKTFYLVPSKSTAPRDWYVVIAFNRVKMDGKLRIRAHTHGRIAPGTVLQGKFVSPHLKPDGEYRLTREGHWESVSNKAVCIILTTLALPNPDKRRGQL